MPVDDPKKPYKLTFEQRPGYLYAYVEGEHDNYDISHSFWVEIAAEVARLGSQRVLIDENIEQGAPMADVFKLATELPKLGLGPARIAFVDRYLEQNEVNEFAAIVAGNRGLNGKIFNNQELALEWLLDNA